MSAPNEGPLWVVGSGGHSKVVVETARAAGMLVAGLLDERPERRGALVHGVAVVGDMNSLPRGALAIVAIGDNRARQKVASQLAAAHWYTAVHPSAVVCEGVGLGVGTLVCALTILQPGATIGDHAIVNSGAIVEHDCAVQDLAQIASGAVLAGGASVGRGSLVGVGATVLPGRRIGAWSTVGAGAVVTRDVPDGVTVTGVPARPQ